MEIKKDKSGLFFTLAAIALLSLAFFTFSLYTVSKNRIPVIKRIESMNSHVFNIEKDLSRKLFISGFRIIFLFEKRITNSGQYISDPIASFNEAFFNGTIEGILNEDEATLMQGITFQEIADELKNSALKLNLNLNIENPSLNVTQIDPWHVHLELTTDFSVSDVSGLASWNKSLKTVADVPVEGFEDPIYIIGALGKIIQKINKTPYDYFANGSNVSRLNDHALNSYYLATNISPSFLNRIAGNFNASPYGIESLVYIPDLSAQGLSIKDKSVVDYIYFSSNNPQAYGIQGMPSWFKLDSAHLSIYNVTNLTS